MQRILRISFVESGTRPSFPNSDSPDRRRVSLHPSVLRHPSALTLTLQEARMRTPQPDEIDPRAVALARKMLLLDSFLLYSCSSFQEFAMMRNEVISLE
ncbi:hypothetical protein CDAR_189081 [Caerostris darwini]|uniref:Uncharacterized protein n=1 Tax=Caerostris darwini TaxID=1538125 RepID=A0AAV4SLX7_9ARAC|nr:hypothetical protein CDAR_189081 [Caerostris darwini]